jgi:hypothetical protein
MLMVLHDVTYGVRAAKVRGRTIHREVSHLFAVRAMIEMFIGAPVVVFHLPFSEESGAQKYSTPLFVLRFKAGTCLQWSGVRGSSDRFTR